MFYNDFSLPDERGALAAFEQVRTESLQAVAEKLDTQTKGEALLVHNALDFERRGPVVASVVFPAGAPQHVRAYGPDGSEVLSQIVGRSGDTLNVAIMATAPGCGVSVYDIRRAESPCAIQSALRVSDSCIANEYLELEIDGSGDIASLKDLATGRQALSAPVALELFYDKPDEYPQWEIRYKDIQQALERRRQVRPEVTVVENGPLRAGAQGGKGTGRIGVCPGYHPLGRGKKGRCSQQDRLGYSR